MKLLIEIDKDNLDKIEELTKFSKEEAKEYFNAVKNGCEGCKLMYLKLQIRYNIGLSNHY